MPNPGDYVLCSNNNETFIQRYLGNYPKLITRYTVIAYGIYSKCEKIKDSYE